MNAKAVWMSGLCGLVLLCAVGLYQTLPTVEANLKSSVDKALTVRGLNQVQARVDGQTVILSAKSATPEAQAQLSQAQNILAQAVSDPARRGAPLPGGALVNSPISAIEVIGTPAAAEVATSEALPSPHVQPYNEHSALAVPSQPSSGLPTIGGDKAVALARNSTGPRVVGDTAEDAATTAARSCEDRIHARMDGRQVSYRQGTYSLTSDSQVLMDEVAQVLATCPSNTRVTVSGYTDAAGDGLVNQTISQARAQSAADALVARGIAPSRVVVHGYGGALPVADNATAEGRAANRRIVLSVNAG